MQIYLGSDHGGFQIKEELKHQLLFDYPDFVVEDCGAFSYQADDDYPMFAFAVASKTVAALESGQAALGILLCRSGSGMVIAANKVSGARAVEIYSEGVAKHTKAHNQANIIAFAGDFLSLKQTIFLLDVFLKTQIDNDGRHQRRLQQINDFEQQLRR